MCEADNHVGSLGQLRALIFDLDGTLVDSSQGILTSLTEAFQQAGVELTHPLGPSLIGPPLDDIIVFLNPQLNKSQRSMIATCFKRNYDSWGYKKTIPFDGIERMLHQFRSLSISLHITTNKRATPTQLILQHLGWEEIFTSVYCPDSIAPASTQKQELLASQLRAEHLSAPCSLYIGDRLEDWHSAKANAMRFAWAQWGFTAENLSFDDDSILLSSPDSSLLISALR